MYLIMRGWPMDEEHEGEIPAVRFMGRCFGFLGGNDELELISERDMMTIIVLCEHGKRKRMNMEEQEEEQEGGEGSGFEPLVQFESTQGYATNSSIIRKRGAKFSWYRGVREQMIRYVLKIAFVDENKSVFWIQVLFPEPG